MSPPAGSGAVQLAWGAAGEMADSAVMVLGWKVLGAAMVLGESGGPGAQIRMGEKNESGLRACFFYFGGCWEWV